MKTLGKKPGDKRHNNDNLPGSFFPRGAAQQKQKLIQARFPTSLSSLYQLGEPFSAPGHPRPKQPSGPIPGCFRTCPPIRKRMVGDVPVFILAFVAQSPPADVEKVRPFQKSGMVWGKLGAFPENGQPGTKREPRGGKSGVQFKLAVAATITLTGRSILGERGAFSLAK